MKSNSEGLIIDGVVAHIDRDNIDTDQIIPTEYLKSIKKFGFEDYLFDGWRYKDDGKLGVSKDDAITALIPKSRSAQTACSLDDPHPKLSRVKSILDSLKGFLLSIKFSSITLSSFVTPSFPSSLYLHPSNR